MTRKRTKTNRREVEQIGIQVIYKGAYKATGFDLHDIAKTVFPEGPITATDLLRRIGHEWVKQYRAARETGLPRLTEQLSLKLRD